MPKKQWPVAQETREAKPTAGPWRVELSSNQYETSGYVCKVVGNCDPGPDGLCDDVAMVATHYDGPAMFSRIQWEANARLIAKATGKKP